MPAFTDILNLSISASWLVLAIAVIRLLLKRAPKALHCALWALVTIRLMCPFTIESQLSLLPSREVIPGSYLALEPGDAAFREPVQLEIITNPVYDAPLRFDTSATADRVQSWDLLATVLWLSGIGAMVIYALYSYLSLRLRVRMAGWIRENIYECDNLETPFILGLFRPRIYLPSELDEITRAHVLAHEKAHLKRLDHIWKPLGFALLCVHWFNPILWWGYGCLCRDIELACDERVIRSLDKGAVRSYSEALIQCTVSRRSIALCPLAFGEVGVKGRIQAMLQYRKPGFWVLALSCVAAVILAVCFLTDPVTPETTLVNVLAQENCTILSIEEQSLALTIPKNALPENVLNGKPHRFDDSPIFLQDYDDTQLLITEARMSGDELLVTIQTQHDLPDTGSILLPSHPFEDHPDKQVHAAHAEVMDAENLYANAMVVRGHGPGSFRVGIKMDVWKQAKEYVKFQLEGMYHIQYATEPQPICVESISVYTLEANDLLGPRIQLGPEGIFYFSESPLSSYLGYGSYTMKNGQLVLKTDDGQYTWTFSMEDGMLYYDAANSNAIRWYPDLRSMQVLPDGARFVQRPAYTNEVEGLLDIICSTPSPSSNPGDYIEANKGTYLRLLEQPLETVSYCFREFAKGHQTDLRGHIMAIACREIIGQTDITLSDTGYMTGQDWFDAFASHALSHREQIGIQELSKFYPWQAMALDILGI